MDFTEIYQRYAQDVHRFALYLSGNSTLAEDLTAETFVRAFFGRSNLQVGTVKAYLFAIARNLYRDALASQRRLVSEDELQYRVDPLPGPEMSAADREMFGNVLRAIQQLPDAEREALVLATDDDLSYEQIAAILGCSVAAIKVRICRARLKLKSAMARREQSWKT